MFVVSKWEHRVMRRRVETYLDGEADATLAALIRRHLAGCPACSEDAECLCLIKTALCQLGGRRPTELAVARRRYTSTLSQVQ